MELFKKQILILDVQLNVSSVSFTFCLKKVSLEIL